MIKVSENNIRKIISYLRDGKALVMKTDTVWGLVSCNVQLLYDMKKRPLDKPFVRLVNSSLRMHDMKELHRQFLKSFWPGPITVVKNGIAYRFPRNDVLNKVINAFSASKEIFCTSANISGGDPIDNYNDACAIFNEWGDNCIYVVPKNDDCLGISSTIVDIDEWRVLREGANVRNVNLWIYKYIVLPFKQRQKSQKTNPSKKFNWNCCNTRWLCLVEDKRSGDIRVTKGKTMRKIPFFSKNFYNKDISLPDTKKNRQSSRKHFKW